MFFTTDVCLCSCSVLVPMFVSVHFAFCCFCFSCKLSSAYFVEHVLRLVTWLLDLQNQTVLDKLCIGTKIAQTQNHSTPLGGKLIFFTQFLKWFPSFLFLPMVADGHVCLLAWFWDISVWQHVCGCEVLKGFVSSHRSGRAANFPVLGFQVVGLQL